MSQSTNRESPARMYAGCWAAWVIEVEAKLRIADRLARGPMTVEELALDTATRARPLHRLLRSLARAGILAEDAGGRFSLTEPARAMRRAFPGSQRAMAVMSGEDLYHAWDDSVGRFCNDRTPIDRLGGEPIFDRLGEQPEKARLYEDLLTAFADHTPRAIREEHHLQAVALAAFNDLTTLAMLGAYDFSGIRVLADVGCGNGSNLIVALGRRPEMRGVMFDLPPVVERIGECLRMAGLTGRCEVIGGDFFDPIPVMADAYHLRHVLHEWDDEEAGLILRNLRTSMPGGARLLVVEHVLPPGDTPSFGKLLDMKALVEPAGVERTEAEFRQLFETAGFRLNRVVPVRDDLSVVEGVKGGAG